MPRITGSDAVQVRMGKITSESIKRVGQALYAGGEEIRAEAVHLITEGSVSGRFHVPSLPGEAPNRDTGVLDTHIETTQVGPLKVEVSSNAPYAIPLEFGSSRMSERPYMRPATARKRQAVLDLVRNAVNDAVRTSKA